MALPLLSACFGGSGPSVGVVGHLRGDFGGVVSDEPRATLVARGVLSSGGTAADAAVALYFALSVTYPSAASLGGGGVCLVHDGKTGRVEALDFTVGAPSPPISRAAGAFGVPGNVRGMFALHSRYGRLRWERVVQPAENLARFGFAASRALVQELSQDGGALARDARARAIFTAPGGAAVKEGGDIRQVGLAAVLGRIRRLGAGEFYGGLLARRLSAGAAEIGGALAIADLRGYRPRWLETVKGSFGNHNVHFPPRPISGGAIAARLWDELKEKGSWSGADDGDRLGIFADAAYAAYRETAPPDRAPRGDGLPDHAVTSFAVLDIAGGAVACSLTMNGRFGAGRMIPGTGILAARPPGGENDAKSSLAPMLVVNEFNKNAYFAAAVSGNAAAPTALISVALKVLLGGRGLEDALADGRFHAGSIPRTVFAEAAADKEAAARFRDNGFRLVDVARLGRMNAIHCPGGMPREPKSCTYSSDRRGHGFAATAAR